MRKTKIIATLGPATEKRDTLKAVLKAGADVVRLNFSHGSHDDHLRNCRTAREIAAELGRPLAVMADLQGPKIRTGRLKDGPVLLEEGRRFVITTDEVPGDAERVSTNYGALPADVKADSLVLLDDGKIRLRVENINEREVITRVEHGGPLAEHKSINLPGTEVSAPSLTEKDISDIRFAVENLQVDYFALSFIRSPEDISKFKAAIAKAGGRAAAIAKIEKPEAVERLEEIIAALELGDGLMVARGDDPLRAGHPEEDSAPG